MKIVSSLPRYALAALLLSASSPAYAQDKWQSHFEAEGKISNDRSIGEGGVFIPLWQENDRMLFTDIRGRFDNQDSQEMNLGLGYRQQINDQWILGGYAFYDQRSSPSGYRYKQATIGAELLSESFELRLNGYLPESDENDIGQASSTAALNNGNFQITNMSAPRERALPGADIEVGKGFTIADNWDFWAYAGGFHFSADGYENITGPRGRVELSYNDVPFLGKGSRFTIGVESQTDDVRGSQSFGLARLRIPLSAITSQRHDKSATRLSRLDQRMTTRIVRDVDVVNAARAAQVESIESASYNLDNGTKVTSYTMIDATNNIAADITAAGNNALIIIDGSQGTVNTAATVRPEEGQTVLGGGSAVTVTSNNGISAVLTLPGSRPTVHGTNAGNVVFAPTAGDDVTLENMTISGGRIGVEINNDNRVTLKNLVIQDTGDDSIRIVASDTLTIDNVSVYRPNGGGEEAIQLGTVAPMTISNITIRDFYAENVNVGFLFAQGSTVNNISFENVEVKQTGNVFEVQNGIAPNTTVNNPSGTITASDFGALCVNNDVVNNSTLTINGIACP